MNNYFRSDFIPEHKPVGDQEYNPPTDVPQLARSRESGDKLYYVENGIKHWITSPEVLKGLGFDFGQDVMIDRAVMSQLRPGDPIKIEDVSKYSPTRLSSPADNTAGEENLPLSDPAIVEGEIEPSIEHNVIPGLTSIIIPAFWNSYQVFHLTGDCIGAIREHTDKLKTPYEIILVINGKTGIGFEEKDYKNTYADKIITNEENKGYGYAINQGIRASQGEFICMINDDVKVFNRWLDEMLSALGRMDLVMATPMYGMPFARAVEAEELWKKESDIHTSEQSDSDFQDFSCVVTKREVFEKIGTFDEQFFLYCEDLDLLRRMKDAGMKYASTKLVNTHHVISATDIESKPEIMNESKAKFKAKWGE